MCEIEGPLSQGEAEGLKPPQRPRVGGGGGGVGVGVGALRAP